METFGIGQVAHQALLERTVRDPESGACGAARAVVSAVCDALGVPHTDTPLTPERVRRALASAPRLRAAA